MKYFKITVALSFLTIIPVITVAHPSVVHLRQGEIRGSYWISWAGGIEINVEPIIGTDGKFNLYAITPITTQYEYGFTGSYLYTEYGLFDQVSIGIKLTPIDYLVNGLVEKSWIFDASAFIRFNLVSNLFNGVFSSCATFEVNKNPLFVDRHYDIPGSGLTTLFSNLSLDFRIIKNENTLFFGYLDIKYITSIVDTSFGGYLSIGTILPEKIRKPGTEVVYGQMHRIVACPGLEFIWEKLSVYIGLNVKVYDISIPGTGYIYFLNGSDFARMNPITDIELGYTLRF